MSSITHARSRTRLGPVSTVRHCLTLTGRNLLHLKASPGEILGFAVIQPVLVVGLLVYVFGGAISGNTESYLQYALPGLVVQSAIMSVLSTGSGLNQDIGNGVFDRLRALPIARIAPLVGHLLGTMVRVFMGLTTLILIGMLQGFELRTSLLDAATGLLLAAAFGMGLAWMSMLVGLVAKTATTVHLFSGVLVFPLTFGSNVYVETDTMPTWLQVWAEVNPITHLTTAMRGYLSGEPLGDSVVWTLGWAVALAALFVPLALRAYRRRA